VLETILRLEASRLAARHQLSEIAALGDPVTGAIPAKVAVAHLRRLRRHRQQVGALVLPLAGGACPAAPSPPCIRNEPAQSSGSLDSKVDRGKATRAGHRSERADIRRRARDVADVRAAHEDFNKTKPPRERADDAPRGPAREQPANLALLGLAMLKLSSR
jgi:hypothetical protein